MIDCDEFRRRYDDWSVEEMGAFYDAIYDEFPDQTHHSIEPLTEMLRAVQPKRVLELGGWDGTAAGRCLPEFPGIEVWTNVEICRKAVVNGLHHPRYAALVPLAWFWELNWSADVLVGCHVIEHLREDHLRAAIRSVETPVLYFEAPITDTLAPLNWWGSPTTHILELGWPGVDRLCAEEGYELVRRKALRTPPESGGLAYAATYKRL